MMAARIQVVRIELETGMPPISKRSVAFGLTPSALARAKAGAKRLRRKRGRI
jgi:hypothetical protein